MPELFAVSQAEFKDGFSGDMLCVNMAALSPQFAYVGLWYACDRNEETFITTEIYSAQGPDSARPADFAEEIKENSFKRAPRYRLPMEADWVWVAARIEQQKYCGLKLFPQQEEKSYVQFKAVKHRGDRFEILKQGMLKGGAVRFCKLGMEDNAGQIDYNDTIMFLVMFKDLPPADWPCGAEGLNVQKLPILAQPALFDVDRTYSMWMGQHPLEGLPGR